VDVLLGMRGLHVLGAIMVRNSQLVLRLVQE
jgi:hypothetical protein